MVSPISPSEMNMKMEQRRMITNQRELQQKNQLKQEQLNHYHRHQLYLQQQMTQELHHLEHDQQKPILQAIQDLGPPKRPRPRSRSFAGLNTFEPDSTVNVNLIPDSLVVGNSTKTADEFHDFQKYYTIDQRVPHKSSASSPFLGNTSSTGPRIFTKSFLSSVVDFAIRPLTGASTPEFSKLPDSALFPDDQATSNKNVLAENITKDRQDNLDALHAHRSNSAMNHFSDPHTVLASNVSLQKHPSNSSVLFSPSDTSSIHSQSIVSDTHLVPLNQQLGQTLFDSTPPSNPPPAPPLPTPEVLDSVKQILTGVINGEQCEIHPGTGLPFASAEKNDEFHKLFALYIPQHERLISEFVCALNMGVLVDGKLWISEHHLCFRGWTSKPIVVLDFFSVIHIEKRNWAGVVPNAIEVETDSNKYFFGTVWPPRNPKYDLLVSVWNAHVDRSCLLRKIPDIKNLTCACSDLDLEDGVQSSPCDLCIKRDQLTSRSRISLNPISVPASGLSSPTLSRSSGSRKSTHPKCDNGLALGSSASPTHALPLTPHIKPRISLSDESPAPNPPLANLLPANPSPPNTPALPLLAPIRLPHPSGPVTCSCVARSERSFSSEGFTVVLDTVVPLCLESVWINWFGLPSKRSLYSRYLPENRKFRDLQFGPWVSGNIKESVLSPIDDITDFKHYNPPMSTISSGYHRCTQYTVPLSAPVGPKQTRSINTQSILAHKPGHYICEELHNHSPDVSTTFYSIGRTCFTFVSPNETRVVVHWKVVFTKSYLTRALIERITVDQMKSFFGDFAVFIKNNLEDADKVYRENNEGLYDDEDMSPTPLNISTSESLQPSNLTNTNAPQPEISSMRYREKRQVSSNTPLLSDTAEKPYYGVLAPKNINHIDSKHSSLASTDQSTLVTLIGVLIVLNALMLAYLMYMLNYTDQQLKQFQIHLASQSTPGL
ncbi:hypothetical protein QVD99_001006 [Batrachochytrium dendrobatidis]|nr:hypothetical protein O5D80_008661 [Batrachochytrium dendrobatidis]KAK5673565.1 hypothetical protein QVD99_001006 [Batrachochytrium dendrobatidis]